MSIDNIQQLKQAAYEMVDKVTESKTVKAAFFSNLVNCRHPLKNGKDCVFLNGRYLTENEYEIRELMEEIAAGHPHIYINPEELVIDTKFVDPIEAIRKQLLTELAAQGKLIAGADADFGTTDKETKLTVGTTRDVAEAMSGSTSSDGAPAAAAKPAITVGPRV